MQHPGFDELVEQIDETTWRNMRRAVETGRWPDGSRLSEDQRALCLRAVLAWEARHLPTEERTGYIERPACDGSASEQPVQVRDPGDDSHA